MKCDIDTFYRAAGFTSLCNFLADCDVSGKREFRWNRLPLQCRMKNFANEQLARRKLIVTLIVDLVFHKFQQAFENPSITPRLKRHRVAEVLRSDSTCYELFD